MHNLRLLISSFSSTKKPISLRNEPFQAIGSRAFSANSRGSDDLGWDSASSWSNRLTKDHFDGTMSPHAASRDDDQSALIWDFQKEADALKQLTAENKKFNSFVDGWGLRMRDMCVLLKQVFEPGARGSYLKDSEKAEIYRLHKQNPEVYTVEKLAKDFRIMRQRVEAILWLR